MLFAHCDLASILTTVATSEFVLMLTLRYSRPSENSLGTPKWSICAQENAVASSDAESRIPMTLAHTCNHPGPPFSLECGTSTISVCLLAASPLTDEALTLKVRVLPYDAASGLDHPPASARPLGACSPSPSIDLDPRDCQNQWDGIVRLNF